VQTTVLYSRGIVNFYHGFDQPGILDRQEMRLQFERGDITLYGWIPVRWKLHGLLKKEDLATLDKLLGSFAIVEHDHTDQSNKKAKGKCLDISYDKHVTIDSGCISEKQNRYQQMLADMLIDQCNWIRNNDHLRIIDDSNAVESIRMAEHAREIAQEL